MRIEKYKKRYDDDYPWTKEQIDLFLRGKDSAMESPEIIQSRSNTGLGQPLKWELMCGNDNPFVNKTADLEFKELKILIATNLFKYLPVEKIAAFFSGLTLNRNVYLWKGPKTNFTERPLDNGQEFWRQIKDIKPALREQIADCMAKQPIPIAVQDWQILDYPAYNELMGIPRHSLDLSELDLEKPEVWSALLESVDPNVITDICASLSKGTSALIYILQSFPQLKTLTLSGANRKLLKPKVIQNPKSLIYTLTPVRHGMSN